MNQYEFIIILVGVICAFIFAMRKLSLLGGRRARYTEEETEIVQQVYKGIARLEKRVEALEMLLMDSATVPPPRSRRDDAGGERP